MLQTFIDAFGVFAGSISIIVIASQLRKTGGRVSKTLALFCLGIVFQTLALLSSLLFERLKIFEVSSDFDLHHALMIAGLVIFVGTAYSLLPFLRTPRK